MTFAKDMRLRQRHKPPHKLIALTVGLAAAAMAFALIVGLPG